MKCSSVRIEIVIWGPAHDGDVDLKQAPAGWVRFLDKPQLHAPDALSRLGKCRREFGLQPQACSRGLRRPVVRLQKSGCFSGRFEGEWRAVVAARSAAMLAVALAHIASAADIENLAAFPKHIDP
jgi:hypothetical protein